MNSSQCILVGSHPWRDLFKIDFTQLPTTTEEAVASLDRDGWAVVSNPDPADRLHLRVKQNSASQSLGKFYNRTPVQVLGQQGEWSQVRIGLDGHLEGWMLTKYLTFSSAMDRVNREQDLRGFIDTLSTCPLILDAWDEKLWRLLVVKGVVGRDGSIEFEFLKAGDSLELTF